MCDLLDLGTQVFEKTVEFVSKRVVSPAEFFAEDVFVDFAADFFVFETLFRFTFEALFDVV